MNALVSDSVTGTSEVAEFHRCLGEQLQAGVPLKSPEQAVAVWRRQRPIPPEVVENAAAVQQALDDIRLGDRGRRAEEVSAELRQRFGLAARP